ncbi:hypothetical protein C453_19105 [Haloferax elongans ATCC BAA-1513]|uniref:MobA-like NTP transferase domain-containing protein n=2 Tax=Haloferax elongans TaxID=403191 RepID=M0H963_HALEO|nr:hypothetical protein C453_19105 [Haloferax elongans ATCC BAA-1513]
MVPVAGRPLLDWLTGTARSVGIDNLAVVTGYKNEVIEKHVESDVATYHNPEYASTDMVRSLWCARDVLEGPVVLSYSDILYTPEVLQSVVKSPHDIAVAVDNQWQSYWERRHENPIEDAESLRLEADDRIASIGQDVDSISAPEAQYIGLVKLSARGVKSLREAYQKAVNSTSTDQNPFGSQRSFENIHMTDLLQGIIDNGVPVHAEQINAGWVEIDTPRDLEIAESVCHPDTGSTLKIDRKEAGNGTKE